MSFRKRALVVLPARMDSTRLPGKPLADICGKPMVIRSYENAVKSAGHFADILVATPDAEIVETCVKYHADVTKTCLDHPTGTDRVAEVALACPEYRFYINAQPDEPLLDVDAIPAIYNALCYEASPVFCGVAPITNQEDIEKASVGKVVMDRLGRCLYISRNRVPYRPFQNPFYTQVCVYGFRGAEVLKYYHTHGQSQTELAEDGIELLRFLDMGIEVQMVPVPGERHAVDTPEDLEKVRYLFSNPPKRSTPAR